MKQEMQAERVAGFKEFIDDVKKGKFPERNTRSKRQTI